MTMPEWKTTKMLISAAGCCLFVMVGLFYFIKDFGKHSLYRTCIIIFNTCWTAHGWQRTLQRFTRHQAECRNQDLYMHVPSHHQFICSGNLYQVIYFRNILLTSCITIRLPIECFTTGELLSPAIISLGVTLIIAIHLPFMCKLRKTTISPCFFFYLGK